MRMYLGDGIFDTAIGPYGSWVLFSLNYIGLVYLGYTLYRSRAVQDRLVRGFQYQYFELLPIKFVMYTTFCHAF